MSLSPSAAWGSPLPSRLAGWQAWSILGFSAGPSSLTNVYFDSFLHFHGVQQVPAEQSASRAFTLISALATCNVLFLKGQSSRYLRDTSLFPTCLAKLVLNVYFSRIAAPVEVWGGHLAGGALLARGKSPCGVQSAGCELDVTMSALLDTSASVHPSAHS